MKKEMDQESCISSNFKKDEKQDIETLKNNYVFVTNSQYYQDKSKQPQSTFRTDSDKLINTCGKKLDNNKSEFTLFTKFHSDMITAKNKNIITTANGLNEHNDSNSYIVMDVQKSKSHMDNDYVINSNIVNNSLQLLMSTSHEDHIENDRFSNNSSTAKDIHYQCRICNTKFLDNKLDIETLQEIIIPHPIKIASKNKTEQCDEQINQNKTRWLRKTEPLAPITVQEFQLDNEKALELFKNEAVPASINNMLQVEHFVPTSKSLTVRNTQEENTKVKFDFIFQRQIGPCYQNYQQIQHRRSNLAVDKKVKRILHSLTKYKSDSSLDSVDIFEKTFADRNNCCDDAYSIYSNQMENVQFQKKIMCNNESNNQISMQFSSNADDRDIVDQCYMSRHEFEANIHSLYCNSSNNEKFLHDITNITMEKSPKNIASQYKGLRNVCLERMKDIYRPQTNRYNHRYMAGLDILKRTTFCTNLQQPPINVARKFVYPSKPKNKVVINKKMLYQRQSFPHYECNMDTMSKAKHNKFNVPNLESNNKTRVNVSRCKPIKQNVADISTLNHQKNFLKPKLRIKATKPVKPKILLHNPMYTIKHHPVKNLAPKNKVNFQKVCLPKRKMKMLSLEHGSNGEQSALSEANSSTSETRTFRGLYTEVTISNINEVPNEIVNNFVSTVAPNDANDERIQPDVCNLNLDPEDIAARFQQLLQENSCLVLDAIPQRQVVKPKEIKPRFVDPEITATCLPFDKFCTTNYVSQMYAKTEVLNPNSETTLESQVAADFRFIYHQPTDNELDVIFDNRNLASDMLLNQRYNNQIVSSRINDCNHINNSKSSQPPLDGLKKIYLDLEAKQNERNNKNTSCMDTKKNINKFSENSVENVIKDKNYFKERLQNTFSKIKYDYMDVYVKNKSVLLNGQGGIWLMHNDAEKKFKMHTIAKQYRVINMENDTSSESN